MPKSQNSRRDKGRTHLRGARIKLPDGKSQWRIEFTHPVLLKLWNESGRIGKRPLTVRKSLKTPDRNEALALRDQFQRIIDDETSWLSLPTDTDPRVEKIWKGEWWDEQFDMRLTDDVMLQSDENHRGEAVERHFINIDGKEYVVLDKDLDHQEFANLNEFGKGFWERLLYRLKNPSPTPDGSNSTKPYLRKEPTSVRKFPVEDIINAAARDIIQFRSENKQLQRDITLEKARTQDLTQKLKAANARLEAIDQRILVERSSTTLAEALESFIKSISRGSSAAYIRRVRGILTPMVRNACATMKTKSKTSAFDLSEAWVSEYIRNYTKRDGTPATIKYRKDLRSYIGRFLTHATNNRFDTRLVKIPAKNRAQGSSKIVWLDPEEADTLLQHIKERSGDYWYELAKVQRFMGWRTSELIWLKASGIDSKAINFEAFHHPHTKEHIGKTGSRRIVIPDALEELFERRAAEAKYDLIFPLTRKPTARQRKWQIPYRYAWDQRNFQHSYRKVLREAGDAAGIEKPLCCRVLRRTFASQLLRDERSVEDVAILLGDNPGTVKKHYARILPDEIDPNLSFVAV